MDPDPNDRSSLLVLIHRLWPNEPRRGMVYDVLIHIISIEDMRQHGLDSMALFYPSSSASALLTLTGWLHRAYNNTKGSRCG
jgi:hypothetical protein